jgi:sialic acid synthase SpsE
LYFVKDIKAGELITGEYVKSIRPGYGLPPKYLNEIIGKTVKKNINSGVATSLELILV